MRRAVQSKAARSTRTLKAVASTSERSPVSVSDRLCDLLIDLEEVKGTVAVMSQLAAARKDDSDHIHIDDLAACLRMLDGRLNDMHAQVIGTLG